jgi:glycosyltransferase 2 family protein
MNRRFALIQALFSLVALGAVVWWASKQDAPEFPGDATSIAWLVGGLGLYAVATLIRGERWHRILHRTGVHSKRSDAYALTPVGYMGNNVLPARAGEMLRVVLLNKRCDASKRTVIGTIVAERMLDAIALASIFVVVVFGVLHNLKLPHDRPYLLLGIGAGAAAALLAAVWFLRRHHVVGRVREFMRPMAGGPRALVSFEGLFLLVVSFAIWALEASVYVAVARSLHIELGAMDGLYLLALTNLFAMIPAAPGYVGTFDAAVIFGFKAIGYTGSAAVSYLILLRFLLFVPITLVGLVILVTRYGGWARLRQAVRLQTSEA